MTIVIRSFKETKDVESKFSPLGGVRGGYNYENKITG
jgi:hypothetical protein